jgi:excisionase family DNA binding protein
MNINDIATKQDIARIEYLLQQLLSKNGGGSFTHNLSSEYITEDKAQEMLGVAKSTLYSMKSRGVIPFYKPEGSKMSYYKISDLEKYMSGIKHKSNREIEIEASNYMLKNKMK